MFGVLLAILCSGLDEVSTSIGKSEIKHRIGSVYTFGFLSVFFGTIFFIVTGFVRDSFVFSLDSLPFFLTRVILETLMMHLSIQAMLKTDRGDYAFLRLLTIPLLLIIDSVLGYTFTSSQYWGMAILFFVIGALIFVEKPRKVVVHRVLLIVALGAITISLYKYDITHFNSVEAEQSIIGLIIALYFFTMAVIKKGENPLQFLRVRAYSFQASASGLSEVVASFAFLFAPAAIITAALRSSAILFAIISGKYYFHEKHLILRLGLFSAIGVALVLLIAG